MTRQETFEIEVPENPQPLQKLKAGDKQFTVTCHVNTPAEVEYYRNGGILHTVLRKMV